MSEKVSTFAPVMATQNSNQQKNPNINWALVLKVTIAVLTALAGALGVSKSEAVAQLIDAGKEAAL